MENYQYIYFDILKENLLVDLTTNYVNVSALARKHFLSISDFFSTFDAKKYFKDNFGIKDYEKFIDSKLNISILNRGIYCHQIFLYPIIHWINKNSVMKVRVKEYKDVAYIIRSIKTIISDWYEEEMNIPEAYNEYEIKCCVINVLHNNKFLIVDDLLTFIFYKYREVLNNKLFILNRKHELCSRVMLQLS